MATFQFHYRPSRCGGMHEGSVYIRVIHNREVKEIQTPYRVFPYEWDDKEHHLIVPEANYPRLGYLIDMRSSMDENRAHLTQIISELDKQGRYTVRDIFKNYFEIPARLLFSDYINIHIDRLSEQGKERTARAYRSVLQDVGKFLKGRNIYMDQITRDMVLAYKQYHKSLDRNATTVAFYMRNFRSIYNKCLGEGKVNYLQENPFSKHDEQRLPKPIRLKTLQDYAAMNQAGEIVSDSVCGDLYDFDCDFDFED
jgi:hypothetical protein